MNVVGDKLSAETGWCAKPLPTARPLAWLNGGGTPGKLLRFCVLLMLLLGAGTALIELDNREASDAAASVSAKGRGRAAQANSAPVPVVEPMTLVPDLARDRAREINALVPFVARDIVAAAPFRFLGNAVDRERALACLAVAVLYEAGDDARGQRAVAQVVLNRLRHPAFPKRVCDVVFQGSERSTGCQFTFTCDGALQRVPNPAALIRAQFIAARALGGEVDETVGLATHYHTDWVVPNWSSRLEKIARVDTHLFFRWAGRWGGPGVFRGVYAGAEPAEPKIAPYFAAHIPAASPEHLAQAATIHDTAPNPRLVTQEDDIVFSPTASNPNVFLVSLSPSIPSDDYLVLAERTCGARKRCVFMVWTSQAGVPSDLPATTSQLQSMAFHYLRDPALSATRVRWNCAITAQADRSRCLSHQMG